MYRIEVVNLSSSSAILLFVCLGLLAVVGMSALGSLQGEVHSNDTQVTSAASTTQTVEVPLFTVIGYVALAIAAIGVLNTFRGLM